MKEFDIFRKAVGDSLTKGKGALLTRYGSKESMYYYGGLALLKDYSKIRVNRSNSLQVEGIYVSQRGNTPQNPGWKPHVEHDAWLSWSPDSIAYDVVFKINDLKFVSELEEVIEEYKNQNILSRESLRPYFQPRFIKPISKALSNDLIKLLFPTDEIKREEAIKHLKK